MRQILCRCLFFSIFLAGIIHACARRPFHFQAGLMQTSVQNHSVVFSGPNPVLSLFKKKHNENRRLIAAICAFPFPFGMVGLHRIYLGCAPYVPLAYIGTAGGMLGIVPLIDFIVIITHKDITPYMNHQQVFMWLNN